MRAGTARFSYAPRGPYSLAATAARFTRWPEVVDCFDGMAYRRLLPVGRRGVLLEARQSGSRPEIRVLLSGDAAGTEAAREAALRVVRDRARRSARCPPLLSFLPGRRYDIRRELALAFGLHARLGGETYFAFPAPSRLAREPETALRRFRLSGAKAGTLARLAEAFASGEMSEGKIGELPDEEAIQRLTSIMGVGRWTAEIALLRGLGRADVFPGADLGVVKYVAMRLLGHRARVTETSMRKFADRWRPYRGLALVYPYAEIARRAGTLMTRSSGSRGSRMPGG